MADPDAALHRAQPGKYRPRSAGAPAPAQARTTGTIADAIEPIPQLVPVQPTQTPPEQEPSWGEWLQTGWSTDTVHAGRVVQRTDRSDFGEIMIRDGYAPILDALELGATQNPAAFSDAAPKGEPMLQSSELLRRQGRGFLESMTNRSTQESLIANAIRDRRKKDPNFLPGVPDTPKGLRAYFLENEKKRRADARQVTDNAKGFGGLVSTFGGNVIEAFHDPINLMTLPVGGGGRTFMQVVGREALVNGVLEAAQQPIVAVNRESIGEELTAGEAAMNVVTAGVGGGIIEGGIHGAGKVVKPAVGKLREELAKLPSRDLVARFRKTVTPGTETPDELAAINVLEREAEVAESSPYEAGPEGDAKHNEGLAAALSEIIDGKKPEKAPTAAPTMSDEQLLGLGVSPEAVAALRASEGNGDESGMVEQLRKLGHNVDGRVVTLPNGPNETTIVRLTRDGRDHLARIKWVPGKGYEYEAGAAVSYFRDEATLREWLGDAMQMPGDAADYRAAYRASSTGKPDWADLLPDNTKTGAVDTTAPARPPAATSTAERPRSGQPHAQLGDLASGLERRGIPPHVARGAAAGIIAESGGDHSIVNPTSGAAFLGQWLGSRKAELIKRYGPNPTREQQLDFIAWELKGGDHGGKSVLASADETAALDAYIRKFMRPAAGKETDGDLSRGMAALGRGGQAPAAAGEAPAFGGAAEDPAIARLKSEALALEELVAGYTNVPGGGRAPLYTKRIPASEALVDAQRFQFKSGGDAEGVIDTLRGVAAWDPMSAGRLTFWQDNDGRYFVADGHQRSALARRIEAQTGEQIMLDGTVLREADGITAETARALAALNNIRNGSGSRTDAAKVMRDLGFDADLNLPPKSAFVRDAQGLARLSDDAFGAVVNERLPAEIAAVVGRLLPDKPELHAGMIDILARYDPAKVGQAESIVRDALSAGVHSEEQIDLFGTSTTTRPLFLERAKVLERALGELRKMRVVHSTAAKNAGELEAKGSRIARDASEKEAQANAEAAEIVNRLYTRQGPVSDALNAAAASLARDGKLGAAADEFVAAVRELDLAALARGSEGADRNLDPVDGAGRGGDAGETGEDLPGEQSGFLDEQPTLLELQSAAERFSDPDGVAVKQQADSLVHDFKALIESGADTRGMGVQLHGARGQLPDLTEGYYNPNNIYGGLETFYTTDAADIAGGYRRKNPDGRIYQAVERAPVKFFDMEEPVDVAEVSRLFGSKPDDFGLVPMAIEEATKDGKATVREVMDEIRGFSREEGVSKDEVQEIFDTAITNLRDSGFGGMTHIGGLKTGREPHTVKIYFDAPNQLELKDVTPGQTAEAPQPVPPAAAVEAPSGSVLHGDLSAISAEDLPALFDALPADRDAWHDLRVKVIEERPDLATEALDQMDRAPAEAADAERAAKFAAIDAIRAEEAKLIVAEVGKGRQLVLTNALKSSQIKHDWQVRATSKGFQFTMNGKQWFSVSGDDHAHLMAQIGQKTRQFEPLEADAPSLDLGEAVDPAIADRQRQELELGAASPMRPGDVDAKGEIGLGLFDAADQGGLTFRLDEEGGEISGADLLAELEADDAAIKAIKDCL